VSRVRVQHLRRLGYCMKGSRRWFRRRGWDWSAFVREGLPAADFRATGDAMATRAADLAEADTEERS